MRRSRSPALIATLVLAAIATIAAAVLLGIRVTDSRRSSSQTTARSGTATSVVAVMSSPNLSLGRVGQLDARELESRVRAASSSCGLEQVRISRQETRSINDTQTLVQWTGPHTGSVRLGVIDLERLPQTRVEQELAAFAQSEREAGAHTAQSVDFGAYVLVAADSQEIANCVLGTVLVGLGTITRSDRHP